MKNILRAALLAVFMSCGGAALAEMVNINKADAAALMENLPGIGEKKADAIIKYRKENGNFKSVDGLLEVPGIGEKTFKNLKSEVSVSKGATKATGKKPVTSVNQTNSGKASDSTTKKDSKPADKAAKTAKKDSKSADKKDAKADGKEDTNKTAKKDKDSKSADKSKAAKKDSKAKSDSKDSSKSKTTKADSKKKPKPKASPAAKSKKSSAKKKKSSTKKKKKPVKK